MLLHDILNEMHDNNNSLNFVVATIHCVYVHNYGYSVSTHLHDIFLILISFNFYLFYHSHNTHSLSKIQHSLY